MTGAFATATAVDRVDETTYRGVVAAGWDISGAVNGGYLLAIAGRAMATAAGRPPATLTAHFLAPGRPGECTIAIETIRTGGRLTTLAATMSQPSDDGPRTLLRLLGSFGAPADSGNELTVEPAPPAELPAYAECPVVDRRLNPEGSGFGSQFELRIRPVDLGFITNEPSGRPEALAWFNLRDEPLDRFAVLLAVDAVFPPSFNLGIQRGWIPTVELTVHLHGDPAPGPLALRLHSDVIGAAALGEDAEVFDSTGRFIAQSRQYALLPRR